MIDLNYENNRLLDVVNKNDEIVGSKSRTDIHKLGLIHREIHVFMFDENKNVFFQKKGLHKAHAGLLDATAAGHVNKGEKYLDSAVREVKEETGINVSPSDLELLYTYKVTNIPKDEFGGTVNNFIRPIFIYKKPIGEKMLVKEEGIQGGGFKKFSYDFLLKLSNEDWKIFDKALSNEIPKILEYLKNLEPNV